MNKERRPEDFADDGYTQHLLEINPASAHFAFRRMMSLVLLGKESGLATSVRLYEGATVSNLQIRDKHRHLHVSAVILPTERAIASMIEDRFSANTLQMRYSPIAKPEEQYEITYGSSRYEEQVAGRTPQQIFDDHLEEWRSILES